MSKVVAASILRSKTSNLLFVGALLAISLVALFNSKSIRAQITNLYSASNDQVAGITSLMTAVASNDIEGVKFFTKAGSSIINQRNFGGATALHIAARENNLEIANLLIENGADVNVSDNEGWTPLMRAARVGSFELVNLFLDKGADAALLNSINESAIIHATTADCDKCLVAMFDKFNFIKFFDNNTLNQQISTSYSIAKNHENSQIEKILGDYLEKSGKLNALLEPQEMDLNQVSPQINSVAAESKKSGKKFKFTVSSPEQIDKVEVVEPVTIKKEEVASVTEVPVKNVAPQVKAENKKIMYKFLGQTGSSIAVQNYQAKVQDLLQNKDLEKVSKDQPIAKPASIKSYKFNGQSGSSIAVQNYNQQHQEQKSSEQVLETNSVDQNSSKVFKLKKN